LYRQSIAQLDREEAALLASLRRLIEI